MAGANCGYCSEVASLAVPAVTCSGPVAVVAAFVTAFSFFKRIVKVASVGALKRTLLASIVIV